MDWQPIETAPRDGTPIQAKIDGYGTANIIIWTLGFIDEDGDECGGWNYIGDEPPPSWTDGVCWNINENLERSAQPTHWRPLKKESVDE